MCQGTGDCGLFKLKGYPLPGDDIPAGSVTWEGPETANFIGSTKLATQANTHYLLVSCWARKYTLSCMVGLQPQQHHRRPLLRSQVRVCEVRQVTG